MGRQAAEDQGTGIVSPDDTEFIAERLLADFDAKTPGRLSGQPLALTITKAYAIQAEVARLREERGERIIGYKVGCTSKPIQEQLARGGADFRQNLRHRSFSFRHASLSRTLRQSRSGGRAGGAAGQRSIRAGCVSEQAARVAIEAVFPVIELHHYVVPEDWPAAQWLIASGGMHAGFVCDESAQPALARRALRTA